MKAKAYLTKLSKMANLGSIDDNPTTPIKSSMAGISTASAAGGPKTINTEENANQSQEPVSAFIISPNVQTKHDSYLLYLQLPKPSKQQAVSFKWTGETTSLYASIPVRNSLFKHKSSSSGGMSSAASEAAAAKLILVTPKQSVLNEKRIELKMKLKSTITLVKEKTSFHPNIADSIDELIDSITSLRKDAIESIKSIERDLKMSVVVTDESSSGAPETLHHHHGPGIDQRYLSELWRVSYNFGIDLQNECLKFMTEDRAKQFANCLADFCIMWCEYIVNKTERGRGRTCKLQLTFSLFFVSHHHHQVF